MDRLDFPRRIQIQTINLCNYACRMCPYPAAAEGARLARMDEALFRRVIQEVREAQRKVKLSLMLQNEPLLDRRFLEFLRHAHDAADAVESVSTVTNGSTLGPALLDELTSLERLRLTVSVNANDPATYLEIHKRDFWQRIHGLLAGWQGRRERVRLSFVFDRKSVHDAVEFQRYWREQGYAIRLVAINARVDSLPGSQLFHQVDEEFGHCTYPVDTLSVLVDGTVILCCNDWEHRLRFGNLHHSSISEVWNSPAFLEYRQASIDGEIRKFPICKGCDYPTRSADRIRLEALVADTDTAPGWSAGEGAPGVLEHVTEVRPTAGGRSRALLVWDLREAEGSVLAFSFDGPPTPVAEDVHLRLNIGISDTCSFSSMDPVWCPGRLQPLPAVQALEGFAPVRITLDRRSSEYRFFHWYCADWRAPAQAAVSFQ